MLEIKIEEKAIIIFNSFKGFSQIIAFLSYFSIEKNKIQAKFF